MIFNYSQSASVHSMGVYERTVSNVQIYSGGSGRCYGPDALGRRSEFRLFSHSGSTVSTSVVEFPQCNYKIEMLVPDNGNFSFPPAAPPIPPMPPVPPAAPPSLPPSVSCGYWCTTTSGATLRCSSFEGLSCHDMRQLTLLLGCPVSCDNCCIVQSPPPPPMPPPPAFPEDACPWTTANSGIVNVLICMDGTSCDWVLEGQTCCDCRGGIALCGASEPLMCAKPKCNGIDYCCASSCATFDGPRPCQSPRTVVPPGHCNPSPPLPPAAPPSPPMPPQPPFTPYVYDWQNEFDLLRPSGANCKFFKKYPDPRRANTS